MSIKFGGIGERPALTVSASLPRTPITAHHNPLEYDEEETSTNDMPVRRAIDIQVGLEKKRQRRREQLYRKQHRKSTKEKRPPPPGRGAERMRGIGLQIAAHKGKTTAFNPFHVPATPDQEHMHVLKNPANPDPHSAHSLHPTKPSPSPSPVPVFHKAKHLIC
ncbi:hypothetical protein N0V95_000090 [Ascochyta clinopodiicola]|nr:hypothetical protein N0V95_000090 [Ascochyta clinopodiicola]